MSYAYTYTLLLDFVVAIECDLAIHLNMAETRLQDHLDSPD